jgi:adenosylcobinamide-phosphate guanylyltransferase
MDAIVMAGGFGQRLGMGEKPCVELLGKPLIAYVIDTLRASKGIDRVFVAVSPVTPKTEIMIHERYKGEVRVIRTFGGNYVGDMRSCRNNWPCNDYHVRPPPDKP